MNTAATFPLNAWYAASWDAELKHELLARTVSGKKIAFYRTLAGEPVALEDACWHRLLPLSMGRLNGDNLVCGYHGLVYNPHGRCVRMPSQETINPSACVRSFPVIERHRFVWVWPGEPALADPALVPDLHWNANPGWAGDGKVIHPACDYRLVVDNLMDLTHETYVHAGSIGNDAVAEAPFEVSHGDHTATVTRWMIDIEPPPFWRIQLGKPGNVDRWQIIHFMAPCTVAIDVGVAPTGTGAPQGDRARGVSMWVINTITPETEKTCHYFWANVRDYRVNEQRITTEIRDSITKVFHEDEVVLEAQQRAIDEHPDHIFYNLHIDAGAMWARRLIDRMIAAEGRAPRSAAAE
ncbi:MAG TPA: aromatic ring-hydroxylating dioxygenase subunit alpha [Stellaceae bacterium]|nr:aromatic ring-hydroxylating dioxygenase subunit alpha [Stellaceae bacterium]